MDGLLDLLLKRAQPTTPVVHDNSIKLDNVMGKTAESVQGEQLRRDWAKRGFPDPALIRPPTPLAIAKPASQVPSWVADEILTKSKNKNFDLDGWYEVMSNYLHPTSPRYK